MEGGRKEYDTTRKGMQREGGRGKDMKRTGGKEAKRKRMEEMETRRALGRNEQGRGWERRGGKERT